MANQDTSHRKSSRWAVLAICVLKIMLALAFGGVAYMKLSSQPQMVSEFGRIGLGQWFRYLTGSIEISGAVLLLWPRSAFFGAMILLGICAGALVAQIGP